LKRLFDIRIIFEIEEIVQKLTHKSRASLVLEGERDEFFSWWG
jgi:hypothetical protein